MIFWNNQNLFSNNYLEYRLPEINLWGSQKESALSSFETIKKTYKSVTPLKLGPGEEAELENKLIQPVLSALGYAYHVQPVAQRGLKKKRPDYALFKDPGSYKSARNLKEDHKQFFSQALTILEVKYWGRRLNDTDKNDILDSRDPTAQTVKYLDDVYFHSEGKIKWAILTNGKVWRLFYNRATSRSGHFYEIDLEKIIATGDIEEFLYFYLFFSKDAFVPDPVTGKTWLDNHLKGTEEYAVRVSAKLKDLIFDKVFEGLAEGFVHFRRNELNVEAETDESRKDIFKGCLTLLYRMLFLLYAESRNLLPVEEDAYRNVSLMQLKQDIYNDLSTLGPDKLSKRSYSYWSRLESLFDIIAKGDSALNVPVYNGGLFENTEDNFLSMHKMSDPFLAEAIELLTVDQEGEYRPNKPPYIDYSSLNVRHLGDIYEGLLEFHIQIAHEEKVEAREKGKSFWKQLSEVKEGKKTYGRKSKGDVYIENSKHERKATGSYYTPHYIVEYIVKNTVGPVLNERIKTVQGLMVHLDESARTLRKQKSTNSIQGYRVKIRELEDSIFSTLFDIKVLDPAMGSGHFLVHTVDYISDKIIAFLAGYPENSVIRKIAELKKEVLAEIERQGVKIDERKLTEVNLIKRMVMKRCIYGVDLNDMAVELAKLSLWLDSFTLGAPLSFLDHHLKCGNSLIGIFEISDVILPSSESYGKVQRALSFMLQVSDLTDATISEAQKSYDLFKNAQQEITPIRRRINVSTAKHFTDLGSNIGHIENLAYSLNFEKEPFPENRERCERALRIAEEKKFFHWRLEFPEVFYTEKGEKENPGFDCVIGNPPYINVEEISLDEREFLMKTRMYLTTIKRMDIFIPFHELSIKLLNNNGRHSFIVPFPLLTQDYGQQLRLFFLNNTMIESIVDLSKHKIFPDAVVRNIIPLFERKILGDYPIKIITQEEDPNKIQEIRGHIKLIDASQFRDTYENMFRIDLTPELHNIQKKIDNKALKFGRIFAASWGARGVPVEQFHLDSPINDYCKKMLKGINVDRYELLYSGKWLLYDTEKLYRPSMPEFFENLKIIFQEVTGKHGLIGVYDSEKYYTDHSLICSIPKYFFEGHTDKKLRKHKVYIRPDEIKLSKNYHILFLLSVMNSRINGFYFSKFVGYDLNVYPENIEYLPIPIISFTTPEKERKERVEEAIELYKKYMVDLGKDHVYEKAESADQEFRALAGAAHTGGKEKDLPGEHPAAGQRVHGIRRRTRKHKDADKISENIERYPSSTRFIESSLGIKSYSELAPYLAQGVERVMAHLLTQKPDKLKVAPEFICGLHKDAFGTLFPSWAGRYRDRNVTVSEHTPPPYFEVPVLMRQYCEDLESRLAALGENPQISDLLLETLCFAEGRFLSIHPFLDFNGRVARMLLFALLYRLDLPPVQLVPSEGNEDEKAAYLNALSQADYFNWQPLMEIWLKRLRIIE